MQFTLERVFTTFEGELLAIEEYSLMMTKISADLEDQRISDSDSEANSDDLADAFDIPMDGETEHKMDVDMPERGTHLTRKRVKCINFRSRRKGGNGGGSQGPPSQGQGAPQAPVRCRVRRDQRVLQRAQGGARPAGEGLYQYVTCLPRS